jgi:hypothetical protein
MKIRRVANIAWSTPPPSFMERLSREDQCKVNSWYQEPEESMAGRRESAYFTRKILRLLIKAGLG